MRLISPTFMVYASTLAADPPRTTEPIAMSDIHAGSKIAKSKPTFHPLKLVRRLINGESDLALRLSSWGIQRGVEAGKSQALPRSSPLTQASTSSPTSGRLLRLLPEEVNR